MTTTAHDGNWHNYVHQPAANDVPVDYVGDFIVPLKAHGCPVVIRRDHGNVCKPRRCGGRRCRDRAVCSGHRALGGKALAWMKGVGNV